MKKLIHISLSALLAASAAGTFTSCGNKEGEEKPTKEQLEQQIESTKRERNSIKEGNKLYEQQRYAEAEVAYKKALEENPNNATAQFNLASSYLKQRGEDLTNKEDSLVRTADAMLSQISQLPDAKLAEASSYDRGNVAYKAEDYGSAIEQYKAALRRNPNNQQARENLRLAQLKKQEQDKNNDKNQDNQDQQQQNQDQQDKNQNQDQNQDQKQDQKDQNKDKDNQQDKKDQNKDQQQKEQKQQQGGLSDAGAQQILKAMEDKENGTRQKVELMKQGEEKRANRRTPAKPW